MPSSPTTSVSPVPSSPIEEQIVALGSDFNTNQYQLVRLAAEYDEGLVWFQRGFASSALSLARMLDMHTSTAHEWIRVGHALDGLPLIDHAFSRNRLSYAKARILTRRAGPENERDLLDLADGCSANRLTTAVAKYFAGDESDDERDERHHYDRAVSLRTNDDGMVILHAALPPAIGKQIREAIDTIVRRVAATPAEPPAGEESQSSGDDSPAPSASEPTETATVGGQESSGDDSDTPHNQNGPSMNEQLRELKKRWQPANTDGYGMPSLAQQRADALTLLFLGKNIEMTTEVVIHVRGDGTTFEDGTPLTNNAVCQRIDQSFIRMLIHDTEKYPIDASNRRRHPTTRQKRVASEAHNHQCVDCQSTDLLELDHNPPYEQTRHTITTELEPRCAPCHRARHRNDHRSDNRAAHRTDPRFMATTAG